MLAVFYILYLINRLILLESLYFYFADEGIEVQDNEVIKLYSQEVVQLELNLGICDCFGVVVLGFIVYVYEVQKV